MYRTPKPNPLCSFQCTKHCWHVPNQFGNRLQPGLKVTSPHLKGVLSTLFGTGSRSCYKICRWLQSQVHTECYLCKHYHSLGWVQKCTHCWEPRMLPTDWVTKKPWGQPVLVAQDRFSVQSHQRSASIRRKSSSLPGIRGHSVHAAEQLGHHKPQNNTLYFDGDASIPDLVNNF